MHKITNKLTGEVKLYTEAEFEAERTRLILEWQKSKNEVEVAKEAEMKARKLLVEFASDPSKEKGTENVDLGNDYKLKIVKKINYGFVPDRNQINAVLNGIESTGEVGKLIADRIVKWNPVLSMTEYNQLDPEFKKAMDTIIVTTEGAPTVEIVEPKAKK